MDLSKLSPAPWYADPKNTTRVRAQQDIPGTAPVGPDEAFAVAMTWSSAFAPTRDIAAANAEFIALARNAFDVMMRRRWGVVSLRMTDGTTRWAIVNDDSSPHDKLAARISYNHGTDPFTALIEADRWWVENVERDKEEKASK